MDQIALNCIFYFNTPQILSFQCVINMIKPNEIVQVLFFMLSLFFFNFFLIFKLYIIVLVLPNIKMNPPQVDMCSPSWTVLPPPSPHHPSRSSPCTSPKHPVSCIEPGLAIRFIHDSTRFNAILPNLPTLSLSNRVHKTVLYISVSCCLVLEKESFLSRESYGFSNSHMWMWELEHKEGWALKKWRFWTVVLEKTLESPWTARRSNQSILKEINSEYSLERLLLMLKLQYFGYLMRGATQWKTPWCWERLKAGEEGDNRGCDSWMTSLT